jgi:hypothetical protein
MIHLSISYSGIINNLTMANLTIVGLALVGPAMIISLA